MKRWFCRICGFVHEGEVAPDRCPICDAPAGDFEAMQEQKSSPASVPVDDGPPQTLDAVRDRARQKMLGICGVYPACDGQPDRICNREAYGKSIGMGGAGAGAGFAANFASLARLRLRMRLVGEHFEPDTRFDFFGSELSMPIMGASTSGVSRYNSVIDETDFCRACLQGCSEAGSLSWRGDTFFYTLDDSPALHALAEVHGRGVPIFKPREQDMLKRFVAQAEQLGCPAVGVDLDGCGSTNMARAGQPVFRKSLRDLRELVRFTSLPFIFKGIMDPDDAAACVEAGAKVVAVSNHGGRVLDATPGAAEALPAIVERVGRHALVSADGGVRTGYDVLKLLALGANFVLIGRDLIRAAIGGGAAGVRMNMEHLAATLKRAMVMTGCANLAAVDHRILV